MLNSHICKLQIGIEQGSECVDSDVHIHTEISPKAMKTYSIASMPLQFYIFISTGLLSVIDSNRSQAA